MESFEQSKMLSSLFLRRVGYLLCTCKNEIYYDSKSIFSIQRALYQWYDDSLSETKNRPEAIERLVHFKSIINEFKVNGRIDSGTKITFMSLLREVDALNFSKLRFNTQDINNKKKPNKRNIFFTKLVKLKFDLSLCSAKEFTELMNKIDNCAIKYIQVTNKCKITMRDIEHLGLRHFMGLVDATVEASSEKNLVRAELSLKRLADAVHYRLVKQLPSCDTISTHENKYDVCSYNNFKVLLQSPPIRAKLLNETNIDLSSSIYSNTETSYTTTDLTNTTNSSIKKYKKNYPKRKPVKKSISKSSTSSNSTINENHIDDSFLDLSHNSIGTTTPLTSSPMSSSSNHSPFKFKIKKNKTIKTPTQHVHKENMTKKTSKPIHKSLNSNQVLSDLKGNVYITNKYNSNYDYQNGNIRQSNYNNKVRSPVNAFHSTKYQRHSNEYRFNDFNRYDRNQSSQYHYNKKYSTNNLDFFDNSSY